MGTEENSAYLDRDLRYDKAVDVRGTIIQPTCMFRKGSAKPLSEREGAAFGKLNPRLEQGRERRVSCIHL